MKKTILILTTCTVLTFIISLFAQNIYSKALTSEKGAVRANSQTKNKKNYNVSLTKSGAEPGVVLARVGESVQFNSKDGKRHHISSGSGDAYSDTHEHSGVGIESGIFGPDEAYKLYFKKKGTYEFHDNMNPQLFVSVIVY